MENLTYSPEIGPAESPKTAPEKFKAKDHWADNGKRKQPDENTSTDSNQRPSNTPEALRQDKADAGGEGDSSQGEEVCVCDQVPNKC